jgi:hypothetical protein
MSRDYSVLFERMKRSLKDVRFVSGAEISPEPLEQFYDELFPERASFLKQNWRWLYQGERGESYPSPMAAMIGDRIVGHGGVIPVRLRKGNEEQTAIWMVDFAIRPEYQRGAIGGGLVLAGMASCPLRVAFLNERSWKMVAKLGWRESMHTEAFQLLLRPSDHPRVRRATEERRWLEPLARWAGQTTRMVWRAGATAPITATPISRAALAPFLEKDYGQAIHAARSEGFLNWRLLRHPHRDQYFVFEAEAPGGGYQAIARVVEQPRYRRLHLLSLKAQPHDNRALSRFFGGIVRWSMQEQVSQLVFVSGEPDVRRVARRWFPYATLQRFAYHANDEAGEKFLGGANSQWELLDGDFEMMFEST